MGWILEHCEITAIVIYTIFDLFLVKKLYKKNYYSIASFGLLNMIILRIIYILLLLKYKTWSDVFDNTGFFKFAPSIYYMIPLIIITVAYLGKADNASKIFLSILIALEVYLINVIMFIILIIFGITYM